MLSCQIAKLIFLLFGFFLLLLSFALQLFIEFIAYPPRIAFLRQASEGWAIIFSML